MKTSSVNLTINLVLMLALIVLGIPLLAWVLAGAPIEPAFGWSSIYDTYDRSLEQEFLREQQQDFLQQYYPRLPDPWTYRPAPDPC